VQHSLLTANKGGASRAPELYNLVNLLFATFTVDRSNLKASQAQPFRAERLCISSPTFSSRYYTATCEVRRAILLHTLLAAVSSQLSIVSDKSLPLAKAVIQFVEFRVSSSLPSTL